MTSQGTVARMKDTRLRKCSKKKEWMSISNVDCEEDKNVTTGFSNGRSLRKAGWDRDLPGMEL
jgi:hypothetical protein